MADARPRRPAAAAAVAAAAAAAAAADDDDDDYEEGGNDAGAAADSRFHPSTLEEASVDGDVEVAPRRATLLPPKRARVGDGNLAKWSAQAMPVAALRLAEVR
jgi:hypothetical protein